MRLVPSDTTAKIASLHAGAGMEIASTRRRATHCGIGIAVTFIVQASRGEDATTTFRLSAVAAIAKGRALAEEGWQVFITDSDGDHYYPSEFDKLLSSHPVAQVR
jgi:hypothetical protein